MNFLKTLLKNKMRKLLIASLITIVLLFLTSCTSDDDNSSSNDTLSGTWKLTAFNSSTAYDLNNDGNASVNLLDELDCLENETLVFGSNNTVVSNNTSFIDLEIGLVVGTTDQFTLVVDCEEDVYSFSLTYTRNGNTIIFNDDGDLLQGTVSGNALSFVLEEEIDVADENGLSTTEDITIVYNRQ
jgi:hypothetical protein